MKKRKYPHSASRPTQMHGHIRRAIRLYLGLAGDRPDSQDAGRAEHELLDRIRRGEAIHVVRRW
jgi:hypothetical protein